MSTEINL